MKLIDKFIFHLLGLITSFYFVILCRGNTRNTKHLQALLVKGDSFIIAANHGSYLDWMVLCYLFRYRYGITITFLAKEKLFKHPFWGRLMRYAKCVRVNNEGTKIIDEREKERLKDAHIGIFPEGKRSRNGQLQPFKSGVLQFAKKFNKTILPIGLEGFYEAWPSLQKLPRIKKMTIYFGKPISSETIVWENNSTLDHLKRTIQILSKGGNDKVLYLNYAYQSAFLDVDNTLSNTNIGELLFYIKKTTLSPFQYLLWKSFMGYLVMPFLLIVDKISRPLVQVYVYHLYRDYDQVTLTAYAKKYFNASVKRQLYPDTHFIVEQLKKQQCKIVLVSTNLDCFVAQIAHHYQVKYHAVCLDELSTKNFREKLQYLQIFKQQYMTKQKSKLSLGIGDSIYDLPIFKHVQYALLRTNKKESQLRHLVNDSF